MVTSSLVVVLSRPTDLPLLIGCCDAACRPALRTLPCCLLAVDYSSLTSSATVPALACSCRTPFPLAV